MSYKPLSQIGGGDVTQSDLNLLGAKLNENIVKDPSKTYLVWKGAAFPNSSAAKFMGTAGMIVDWGDGTVETFSSAPTRVMTHSYTDGVEYHLIAIENLTALQPMAFRECNNLIKVILGNTLTEISTSAFRSCQYLTEIIIPDSVTKIASYAFYFCIRLENIQIPGSVLTIGDQVFASCYRFTKITIPDSITSLGTSAFSTCTSLIEVTVSKTIASLNNTFYNCSSLVKIYMRRDSPPTITGSVLPSTLSKIIVPKSAVSAYKAATGWSSFANKIVYEVDSGDLSSGGKIYRHLLVCSNYGNKITYKIVVYSSKSDAITTDYVLANPTCLIGAISMALDNEQGTNSFDRIITGVDPSGPPGYFGIDAGGIVPPVEMIKIDSDTFAAI